VRPLSHHVRVSCVYIYTKVCCCWRCVVGQSAYSKSELRVGLEMDEPWYELIAWLYKSWIKVKFTYR
jgi:hypothetical protein